MTPRRPRADRAATHDRAADPTYWRPALTDPREQYSEAFFTRVESALSRLSPREHQTLVAFAKGYSYAEICAQRGVAIETVKSQLYSARKRLGVAGLIDAIWLLLRYDVLKLNRELCALRRTLNGSDSQAVGAVLLRVNPYMADTTGTATPPPAKENQCET